jgi:hypothetical protein
MVLAEAIARRDRASQMEVSTVTTTHRSTAALLALSLATAAPPVASAKFLPPDPPTTATAAAVYSHPDKSLVPVDSSAPFTGPSSRPRVPPAVVQIHSNGFDWGDAGIGAAGGLALSMIALGGGLAASQRRTRSGHHSTA